LLQDNLTQLLLFIRRGGATTHLSRVSPLVATNLIS
jgi:hypothetical protein